MTIVVGSFNFRTFHHQKLLLLIEYIYMYIKSILKEQTNIDASRLKGNFKSGMYFTIEFKEHIVLLTSTSN